MTYVGIKLQSWAGSLLVIHKQMTELDLFNERNQMTHKSNPQDVDLPQALHAWELN